MPAHQASDTLERCLAALLDAGVPPGDIIVVDDGSRDGTGDIARRLGTRVIRNDPALRPARARNAGVAESTADIILFVDADVVPHKDAPQRLIEAFRDPEITAVFGSYDTVPEAPSIVSRYRNLLHYFTHQRADTDAHTFWTGLGAVRRVPFQKLGGFDPMWENIEDLEFGLRMRADGGKIRLDPAAQGTHLKDWTLASMFKTDLWGRAVPWTRLILADRMPGHVLNGSAGHRLSAACVILAILGLFLTPFVAASAWVILFAVLFFLVINWALLAELYRIGGISLAAGAVPYHAAHYVAALLGYVYAHVRRAPEGPDGRATSAPPAQPTHTR